MTFSKTEEEIMNHERTFCNVCKEYGLMLSAKKYKLFAKKVK